MNGALSLYSAAIDYPSNHQPRIIPMLLRRFTIFSLFLMGLAILTGGLIHEVQKASAQKPIIDLSQRSRMSLSQ
jgi:hypothetical protein